MTIVNTSGYNIKMTYADISINEFLVNELPMTVIAKAKSQGYIYFSDLAFDLQYKIAVDLFKKENIIRYNYYSTMILDYSLLPFTDRADEVPIEDVDKATVIQYFYQYNVNVKDLLITVYKDEYQTAIKIPSIFLDTVPGDILTLETDIPEFIVNQYKQFISTPNGSIVFMPWFGTKLKEYLHTLSVNQVAEMLQTELDGLTFSLKSYLMQNDVVDYDFKAEVSVQENLEYGIVNYYIMIIINDQSYTIKIV